MSLLKSTNVLKLCFKHNPILVTAVRNHWNKDYKPGPYPTTAEERAAAAKKYGILPEEYKTFPDDGNGYGDYPNIEAVSGDSKDPFYPYDFPELKRNFGEPFHVQADMIGEDRCDVNAKHRYPGWVYWAQFFGFMFGTGAIYFWCENFKMFLATIPKQYPAEGKIHYTFEQD